MSLLTDQKSSQNLIPAEDEQLQFPVPETWPHANGPLHALLGFQEGVCAICTTPVEWRGATDPDEIATNNLRQWVEDDLLLGLVCYRCARRYKTLGFKAAGLAASRLPRFLADPPAQRCPATAGLGSQKRPSHFDSRLKPTEAPSPETWSYTNTVVHSLFLWQRGRCAICSTGLTVASRPGYVHVDHDNATDLIRGLLCHRCNTCLGKNWPRAWWEHHEPTVQAYLGSPPAQICPATKGLKMAQRRRPAVLSWSGDRQEVLLDGMPMGIATPAAFRSEKRWYAIRYAAGFGAEFPPVMEASLHIRYADADGEWIAFLLDPPSTASHQERRCILRLNALDVEAVSEHDSMGGALGALSA